MKLKRKRRKKMDTIAKLNNELEMLKEALKSKDISVNDYSSMYLSISKRIKSLEA